MLVADAGTEHRFAGIDGVDVVTVGELPRPVRGRSTAPEPDWSDDPDASPCCCTPAAPAANRRRPCCGTATSPSYVLGSVEFLGADRGRGDAGERSAVPHRRASPASLTAVYGGRRLVQLPAFDPPTLGRPRPCRESITHAMTVPTMLARILDVIDPDDRWRRPRRAEPAPPVVRRRPHAGAGDRAGDAPASRVPTSSTPTASPRPARRSPCSTPDDHRAALTSDDPAVRRRLGSVGRPLPTVEITRPRRAMATCCRPGSAGRDLGARRAGLRRVPRIATGSAGSGWFTTRDGGWFDAAGYLYVEGRMDDVIVRGGENLSPGEIEDVLLEHPAVREAAVVGIPDEQWGEVGRRGRRAARGRGRVRVGALRPRGRSAPIVASPECRRVPRRTPGQRDGQGAAPRVPRELAACVPSSRRNHETRAR